MTRPRESLLLEEPDYTYLRASGHWSADPDGCGSCPRQQCDGECPENQARRERAARLEAERLSKEEAA